MINGQKVLAVIPARGGSKRVPRKNIRDWRGKPLIAWAIDAAEKSRYIDMTFVCTEDAEIRAVAECHGGTVIDRPAELATDDALNEDVCRYVARLHPAYWIVLLQPTSPLRTTQHIDECIERAQMGDACISFSRTGDKHGGKNGAVYVAKAEWLAKHDFSHQGYLKYVMDDEVSLDIDTPEDFDAA